MKPVFTTSKTNKDAYDTVDTLIVDVSWVAQRHAHARGDRMTTSGGAMSGHVYGAFKDIRALLMTYRPRNLAFCYDRGYQWRLDLVPSYKEKRRAPDKPKKFSPAPDVERLFHCFPGQHLAYDDCEADDMIAWLVANSPKERDGALVIYARDQDLWQLVNDGDQIACMFPKKPGPRQKNKDFWVREKVVKDTFGVGPASVAKLKALMGDTSDCIKGLIGARKPGKKDALRDFAVNVTSDDYFDEEWASSDLRLDCPDWLFGPLIDERDRILDNYAITNLEFGVERVQGDPREATGASLAGAMDVLAEFECESLLAQAEPLFTRFVSNVQGA